MWLLFFFFVLIEACSEVIYLGILTFVLILGTEDLTGESFFECFLPAFGLEALRTVAGGLGIRPEILPGGAIATRLDA